MPRIAIVGSCITRDLWPIRGDGMRDVIYISRTSLPSLLSAPLPGFRPAGQQPAALGRHQHAAVVADLQKTAVARLIAFQPTHVIFDFIDERYDLLAVGPAIVSHTWELEASGYMAGRAFRRARTIPRLSGACERLWTAAAEEFAALVRATPLRNAHLILHSARWASEGRGADGELRPITYAELLGARPADIAEQNRMLEAYEAHFTGLMPPMTRVEAPVQRLADEAHKWGHSPFHYVPEYYAEIWRQLEGLGVEPPASARRAWPSAPAA